MKSFTNYINSTQVAWSYKEYGSAPVKKESFLRDWLYNPFSCTRYLFYRVFAPHKISLNKYQIFYSGALNSHILVSIEQTSDPNTWNNTKYELDNSCMTSRPEYYEEKDFKYGLLSGSETSMYSNRPFCNSIEEAVESYNKSWRKLFKGMPDLIKSHILDIETVKSQMSLCILAS